MARWVGLLVVVMLVSLGGGTESLRAQAAAYEVWTIDQADAARGGAKLYIYDGARAASGQAAPEIVDLNAAAAGVGDGAGVRPHMLHFNHSFTHAIIANVASGHVYVMRAADRRMVASIDVGEQAHHAEASPDGAFILVANQNGKRLARIRTDFAAERFVYNRADDLDLGAMEDAAHPDNAPICPVVTSTDAYVTLRGGGLYLVDYRATPMRVLRSYGREQIAPAGCGGAVAAGKVYINSGSPTSSDLYVFDPATRTLRRSLSFAWAGADAHGVLPVAGGRYLWMNHRADWNIVVVSTTGDTLAGFIPNLGGAPDIMGASPDGRHVFIAMRGPNNLTGGPTAKGIRPGVAVFQVQDGGRAGRLVGFLPIGDQTPVSPADPHTLAVRPVGHPARH
jgi:DNA-binding beta-propeller fold protein YncE